MIKKFIKITALILIGAVSVLAFGLFALPKQPQREYNVSLETMDYTQKLLQRYKGIMVVYISTVDLGKNSKTMIYAHANDDYDQHRLGESKSRESQLFTKSLENNQQVMSMINGDIVCQDFASGKKSKIHISSTLR